MGAGFTLRDATPADVPVVLHFVRALAEYEKLLHEAKARLSRTGHCARHLPSPCATGEE
jgi:hypothetical protein